LFWARQNRLSLEFATEQLGFISDTAKPNSLQIKRNLSSALIDKKRLFVQVHAKKHAESIVLPRFHRLF